MRAVSLLATLVLAKALVLVGRDLIGSPWAVLAFFWQDLLVALCFALLDLRLRHLRLAWAIYAIISLYAAINVPLTNLFSTPLTWPMVQATRGALADSVRHHLTWENLRWIAAVLLGATGFPILAKRFQLKLNCTLNGFAWAIVALGPLASTLVETQGLHRNALFALLASTLPRIQAQPFSDDWRASPFASPPAKSIEQFHGLASGRNVILVLLESTGAAYLHTYGAAEDPTPNLTAMAKSSIVLENAYAVYPESIKGLFSVLCSEYAAMDTAPETYERAPNPSVAQTLRHAGYRTALFHSGRFDYLGMQSIIRNRGFEVLEDAGNIGGNHQSSFGVEESSAVKRILHWIDTLAAPDRFFITYLPIAGHHPYDSVGSGPFPDGDDLGRYRNALHCGDAALGDLIGGLQERGLYEKTLFVFLGDHGEAFGQHSGNFGHTLFIYEENVRVPCLIAAPGALEEQTRIKPVASTIDLAPTILELLDIPTPREFEGRSVFDGANRMALFHTDYSLGLLGVRDENWKFIYEVDSDRGKLFDLSRDPREQINLATQETERVRFYRERLLRWSAAERDKAIRFRNRDETLSHETASTKPGNRSW